MNDKVNPRADKQELIGVLIVLSVAARRSAGNMDEERMETNHEQNG